MNAVDIPFNKPFITGNELEFIKDAVDFGQISGNGKYTKMLIARLQSISDQKILRGKSL